LANMKNYLADLKIIVGRTVEADELMNLEETKLILERREYKKYPTAEIDITVNDIGSGRFEEYIKKLNSAVESKFVVISKLTAYCGLLIVGSLFDIDWDNCFRVHRKNIYIVTIETVDRLLVDFDVDDEGAEAPEVAAQGMHWSNIRY